MAENLAKGGARWSIAPYFIMLLPVAALVFTTLACSDSPSQPALESCPGDTVTVAVGDGLTPLITWSPDCGVAFLEVHPSPGGPARWTVYAESGAEPANPIRSGVRYGVTPPRATTVAGPEPLMRGTVYEVRVSRLLCDQGVLCSLLDAGGVTFQP